MPLSRRSFIDFFVAVLVGLISVIVFDSRSGWTHLNLNQPLSYFADPIYYANLVRNAQSGSALLGSGLGAPGGQQYGLSAYGFEWIQSHFIALFAPENLGPWLALNRFSIYTFFATGFCSYLAIRWMNVRIFPAAVGAVAFTLIPSHQVISPGLGNMSALALVLGVIWKLASGQKLDELFIWNTTDKLNAKHIPKHKHKSKLKHNLKIQLNAQENTQFKKNLLLNLVILLLICFFQLTAALYYIIFTALLAGSLLVYRLLKGFKLRESRSIIVFLSFQTLTLLIALLPIIFSRFARGLPFSEPSTGDRRPFAAYANGGDPFGILSPFSANSIYYQVISKIPSVQTFYSEYFVSPITLGSEYIFYPSGFVFVAIFLLLIIIVRGHKGKYKGLISQIAPLIILIFLTVGWYLRGGFGTYFSFIFPYVRGYARFSAILIFLGIAFLGYFASQERHTSLKIVSSVLLLAVLIDTVSNIATINQNMNKAEIRTVGKGELPGSSLLAKDIELRTLGYVGTQALIKESESQFDPNCSIVVLPLVSFMVDFKIGITSYYTLELIKPGLEPSTVKWSAGGIAGTPNNAFTDRNLISYQSGEYKGLFDDIESTGFCGVLIFRGLQKAFYDAGPQNGSNYGDPEELFTKLVIRYGKPCYSDLESAVDLFCLKKKE